MNDLDTTTLDVTDLERMLGYVFKRRDNLDIACHHKSIRNKRKNNAFERLEFLGDRVLGLAMADILYTRHTKETEGDLAKRFALLVSKESCLKVAEKINLQAYMKVNKAELTPHSNILPDALEALLGALYLESDFKNVKKIIFSLWEPLLVRDLKPPRDPKTTLQEYSQATFKCVPSYKLLEVIGPDHAPLFRIQVSIPKVGEAAGDGITKRQAEQAAAQNLLKDMMSHD